MPSVACTQEADVSQQEDTREDGATTEVEASNPSVANKPEVEVSDASMANSPPPEASAQQEPATACGTVADGDAHSAALASCAQQQEDDNETEMPRNKTPAVLPPLKMPPRRGLGGPAASAALGGTASAYAMRRYGQNSQVSRPGARGNRSPSPEAGLVEGQPLVDGGTVVLWKGSRSSVDAKTKSVTPR